MGGNNVGKIRDDTQRRLQGLHFVTGTREGCDYCGIITVLARGEKRCFSFLASKFRLEKIICGRVGDYCGRVCILLQGSGNANS